MGEPAEYLSISPFPIPRCPGSVLKRFRAIAFVMLCLAVLCVPGWASRTLQDESGRTVILPDQVKRVITLTPSLTDTVYALGAASQLVGITAFSEYPPQAAKEKPSVGDILNPSIERIVQLRPDVVLAVSTFNSPETVKGIERVGIPVFLLSGRGLAGVYSTIASVGKVLGRDREATELSGKLKAREAKVREEAGSVNRISVFLTVQLEPCITAGRGAFVTELIELAGARSVTSDIAQDWSRASLEAIIPRNPDYVLIMKSAPFGLKDMQARAGWRSLEAVRKGRILYADDRLQIPGPSVFDGLEDLARQIEQARSATR